MVRLDHDGELGPLRAVYGTMGAELEVQRTSKTAELTAFLCLLKKSYCSPSRCMLIIKELLISCGEEKGNALIQNAGDADLRIKIGEELHLLMSKEILVEVERMVKRTAPRRTRKICRILRGSSLMAMRKQV